MSDLLNGATLNKAGDFSHIDNFIFDLDNTLYPRTCDLFTQIDVLITNYVISRNTFFL